LPPPRSPAHRGPAPMRSSLSDPASPSTLNSQGVTVSLMLAERAMIRRHKVRLVVSFGAIVASIMVPFLTFRFATELSIVSIEGIAALWRSAQVPLLDLGIYGAITGLSVLFGAVIGIRFWNHFLTRVVPQLLGSRRKIGRAHV